MKLVNPQDPPNITEPITPPIGEVPCNYENFMKYDKGYHLFVRIYCGDVRVVSATPATLTVHIPTNHETMVRHHDEVIPITQPERLWVGAVKGEGEWPDNLPPFPPV